MDIRQLRYFVTVSDEGQITRAAKKLNMAQPPLSQQLKLIEDELGTPLFIRNSRSVELTEAGMLLYERAVSILTQIDDTVMEVKETGDGLRGQLSIGTARSCGVAYLPERIQAFHNQYPLVTFRIEDGHPHEVVKFLEDRLVELAVVRFVSDLHLSYESKTLHIEPYVLFIPSKWEWNASRTTIHMKDLEDIPLVMFVRENRHGKYTAFQDACVKLGVKPNIICESHDAAMIFSFVATGMGAAVMPKSTFAVHPSDDIKTVEIEDCPLRNKTSLIWDKNRPLSKGAQRFIEMF
ncbi:LysR family transcriptional regulator [Niallia endozanthoxylica]|uniref:LysR family transcriptional regulator n=1 Tax=Niallia endozanthoxylica TaxID=2036016 RepID=A0A5J5IAI7_9BACI|nr:LysR family transcriptional regulator [Niallia endozanthoxylica]KAA9031661.1 LysR family transcriptional regulator [Niallia endozanthoxylica]